MRRGLDILFFAEDPGAANFIAPLVDPLRQRGVSVSVAARGYAETVLQERDIGYKPVTGLAAEYLLDRLSPRVVVTGSAGNHNPLTAGVLRAARRRAVVTAGVVDARMNVQERWRGGSDNPLHFAPDWLLVPDDWTANAFLKLGFRMKQMAVVGHPHYDYVREVDKRLVRQNREELQGHLWPQKTARQRVLTFVTEGSQRARAREDQPRPLYQWGKQPARGGRVEVALAAFLAGVECLAMRPYLALCVHPKDRVGDYGPAERAFDFVRKREPMLELLYASDVVVGLTSMALAETVLLSRPVISILPWPEERAWLPEIVQKAGTIVGTPEELSTALHVWAHGKRRVAALTGEWEGAAERASDWLARLVANVAVLSRKP